VYALKVVDKENLRAKNLMSRIKQEVQVHRQLDCQYIARLYHFFEDEQNVYLLMEHCEGSELYSYVKQQQAKGYRRLKGV
jgi:serine/threonine protein kinase